MLVLVASAMGNSSGARAAIVAVEFEVAKPMEKRVGCVNCHSMGNGSRMRGGGWGGGASTGVAGMRFGVLRWRPVVTGESCTGWRTTC